MKALLSATIIAASANAVAAETQFCAHQDAAEVLDQFMFSTTGETNAFLTAFTAQNARHAEVADQFEAASKSGQKDLIELAEKAKAKAELSLRIEAELRCRLLG